ncbi:deoxynucleoside kinase [Guptibacillus algicola]|uniref:deoxynucleoside kinase n=1 Tax=Guptibacillus algicola TaxID=225844 RepID=UPI001CD2439F|nr:deoxynucleoside kinase [Alkalihalobacillus algicola]MCA0989638.1 deoxynucleoside kinase [Alkalihalobacillus algicola]
MNQTPFIAVEGPIGIGKTSLSQAIADYYQFKLFQEIVEENPFLGKFYGNIEEWSFQTEMFFLSHRYKQLEDMDKHYLSNQRPVISDYHIFKNKIFAQQTLSDKHFSKYMKIYDILTEGMPEPNVIIYLNASLETLLNRISQRGRQIEKDIDPSYLKQLSADYERFMQEFEAHHPDIPVLRFNGDEMDFVANEEDLQTIFESLELTLKEGDPV